jgi:uncharacterized protein
MFASGKGVQQDDVEAAKWYRKAADQGYADADYNIGFMYATGQGVPQDYVQAYQWFETAAARYARSETESRARAVKYRDLIAKRMTPAQIAEAEKLERDWKSQ